jgi:microcystin-dependent protein
MTIQYTPNLNLPYPQLVDSADVPRDVEALAEAVDGATQAFIPTGALMMWATAVAPSGWAICDGSNVPQSGVDGSGRNWSKLFAVLGTTFNDADTPVGQFKIPDLRGRCAVGAGAGTGLTARALAQSGGEEKHLLLPDEMAKHSHTGAAHSHGPGTLATNTIGNHTHGGGADGFMLARGTSPPAQLVMGAGYGISTVSTTVGGGSHSHAVTSGLSASSGTGATSEVGADTPHNVMQPFFVINYVIKYL